MGMWSSRHGKFLKKDPDHGKWGRKIKHWFCSIGLCNLDKCESDHHKGKCCEGKCKPQNKHEKN